MTITDKHQNEYRVSISYIEYGNTLGEPWSSLAIVDDGL